MSNYKTKGQDVPADYCLYAVSTLVVGLHVKMWSYQKYIILDNMTHYNKATFFCKNSFSKQIYSTGRDLHSMQSKFEPSTFSLTLCWVACKNYNEWIVTLHIWPWSPIQVINDNHNILKELTFLSILIFNFRPWPGVYFQEIKV